MNFLGDNKHIRERLVTWKQDVNTSKYIALNNSSQVIHVGPWCITLKWSVVTFRPLTHRGRNQTTFSTLSVYENCYNVIQISLRFSSKGPIDLDLLQIMACHRTGHRHGYIYLMQYLHCIIVHICVTRLRWVDSLRPRRNRRHFSDDIFKCIFLNGNIWISIKMSLKLVPKSPIKIIPALVQIMAWCWPGDKPLSEPMVVRSLKHMRHAGDEWVEKKTRMYFTVICGIIYNSQHCIMCRNTWYLTTSLLRHVIWHEYSFKI